MKTKRIQISDNLKINLFDSSLQNKYKNNTVLIFIHGGAGCLLNWKYQLTYFSKVYRTIAYDWRGCGHSDNSNSYSFDDHYQDLSNIIKILKVKSNLILIGHSYGSLLALRYQYKNRTARVVNVCFGISSDQRSPIYFFFNLPKFIQFPLYYLLKYTRNPTLTRKLLASKYTPLSKVRKFLQENNIPSLECLRGLNSFQNNQVIKWLKSYRREILIVGGEEDRIAKLEKLEYLSSKCIRPILELIPKAAHILPYEQPKVFNTLLIDFIKRVNFLNHCP